MWTVVMFDGIKWWHTGVSYDTKKLAQNEAFNRQGSYEITLAIQTIDLCVFC